MSDLNTYTFTGRLGNDAEVKYTQAGKAIWTASVGVGYGYGDNRGTNWIRVSTFDKRAEALGKLELRKGAAIGVTGELRVRTYDTREGGKGTSVEVVAQDVALLGGKPDSNTPSVSRQSSAPRREAAPTGDAFADDLDVPF